MILAESVVIALVAYAALAPGSSQVLLGRVSAWLERRSRAIVIVLGLVFGTWFLLKALSGLGADLSGLSAERDTRAKTNGLATLMRAIGASTSPGRRPPALREQHGRRRMRHLPDARPPRRRGLRQSERSA